MFLKYFDYLSPRITFYHNGFLSHTSIFSGIVSIIAIIFLVILIIYFFLDLIQRKDPNTFYFNSFIEDAGIYKINKTSLFHFVSLSEVYKGQTSNPEFDFESFNIIGIHVYIDNYLVNVKHNPFGIKGFDHWIYGYCDKSVNTEGLDDILNFEFFETSACIKKFYNATEKNYYEIGDPKFIWPEIAYGTFNDLNRIYGIFIQNCNNNTIKEILGPSYICKTKDQINEFFNFQGSRVLHLYFVNNYVNVKNYNKPNSKFFYRIENPLNKDQYSSNDINFNPSLVHSHNGLVFDHIREDIAYSFDRNDVYIGSNADKDIYIAYHFFLKNIVEYYERNYKRVQEIISSIGGINQAITIIGFYLNQLYNSFVVLSDTEFLLHSSIYNEKNNYKKKVNDLKNSRNKIKDLDNKFDDNKKKKNSNSKKIIDESKNNNNNFSECNKTDYDKSNNIFMNYKKTKDRKEKKSHINENLIDNKYIRKIDTINKENMNYINKDNNFWNFLLYIFTFKRKKKLFKIYENFRIKIISEEHLIRNHLQVYNLMRVTERKRYHLKSSYQLKDLIRLV